MYTLLVKLTFHFFCLRFLLFFAFFYGRTFTDLNTWNSRTIYIKKIKQNRKQSQIIVKFCTQTSTNIVNIRKTMSKILIVKCIDLQRSSCVVVTAGTSCTFCMTLLILRWLHQDLNTAFYVKTKVDVRTFTWRQKLFDVKTFFGRPTFSWRQKNVWKNNWRQKSFWRHCRTACNFVGDEHTSQIAAGCIQAKWDTPPTSCSCSSDVQGVVMEKSSISIALWVHTQGEQLAQTAWISYWQAHEGSTLGF